MISLKFSGEPVDLDNLQIFNAFPSFHTWTSTTVFNHQALVVTRKTTAVVTLDELGILSRHLGIDLQVDAEKNGRLWAFKQKGKTVISNKSFNEVPTVNSMNFTTCKVSKDVISFHTQLQNLVSQAQHIHKDFIDIDTAYPALNLLSQTCFQGKSFKDLMKLSLNEHKKCIINKQAPQKAKRSILGALVGDSALINQLSANMNKALHIQDTNFAKIYELDKSLVHHLNSILENEKSHDKDIRLVYQLVKSMGYCFDLIHNRAISFNLRTHQGHSIAHELTSLDKALGKLKDALHHTNQCTFSQCVISRHLNTIDNEKLLLSEKVQRYRLDTHYSHFRA